MILPIPRIYILHILHPLPIMPELRTHSMRKPLSHNRSLFVEDAGMDDILGRGTGETVDMGFFAHFCVDVVGAERVIDRGGLFGEFVGLLS